MSEQVALVRVQLASGALLEPGDRVDRDGLDWKYRPLDQAEFARWDREHRDDERVRDNRRQYGPSLNEDPPVGTYPNYTNRRSH